MRKTITLMMLLVAFGFTSCSNEYDYDAQSNDSTSFYEKALKSKEFALYCESYNLYMSTMNDFVAQLSDEQKSTLIYLKEVSKSKSSENQLLFEHYWTEISAGHYELLEELHLNTIKTLDAFNKKYANYLSDKDKEQLNNALFNSSSIRATAPSIKTRAVENNDKDEDEDEDEEDNTQEDQENDTNENTQTNQECISKCEKEYEEKKISLAIDALCETAINVGVCVASYGTAASGSILAQAAVMASYSINVAYAKSQYDACIESCD